MSSLIDFIKTAEIEQKDSQPSSTGSLSMGNNIQSKIQIFLNVLLLSHLIHVFILNGSDQHKYLTRLIVISAISCFINLMLWAVSLSNTFTFDYEKLKHFVSSVNEYINETSLYLINSGLMTLPFQVVYYLCKRYYISNSDIVFLFLAIESVIRYCLIIRFYYSKPTMSLAVFGIVMIIHMIIFQGKYVYLTFFYSIVLIFSTMLSFLFEKYLNLEFFNAYRLPFERKFMEDIVSNLQYSFLICNKDTVLFKNKSFDQICNEVRLLLPLKDEVLNEIEDEPVSVEVAVMSLESILAKIDSVDFFDYDINIEIVNFFVEEATRLQDISYEESEPHKTESSCEEPLDKKTHRFGFESPGENMIEPEFLKQKVPHLPLLTDESEEDSSLNMIQKRTTKPSLFSRKGEKPSVVKEMLNLKKPDEARKIQLNKFHEFMEGFKEEFHNFSRLATVPISISSEKKYYEILMRINTIFTKPTFEYIINDVTKVKNSEDLKKDIKLKSLFLAKIAHEFKNPIITISNLCTSLTAKVSQLPTVNNTYVSSEEDSEDEKANHYLSKRKASYGSLTSIQETSNFIQNTGNYMMSLIEDLNYFSKIELQAKNMAEMTQSISTVSEQMAEFELKPVLEFCLTIFRLRQKQDENKRGVRILSDYDKRLPERINSSQVKLKQILINLLSNAYKFTIYGSIKLCAKVIEREGSNFIHFEVTDTGTGIPPEQMQNLCKPFSLSANNQNLNSNGSGLGLFIVKDLINKLGSNITIESKEGKGSSFGFDIKVTIQRRGTVRQNPQDSQKTLIHQPVMTESLKNLYSLFQAKNIHENSDNLEESLSRIGSNKFESRDSISRFKNAERCPAKKRTLKDFYKYCLSSKNINEISSGSDNSFRMQITQSDNSSSNNIINNTSSKHILFTKFSPFDNKKGGRSLTPNHSSKKHINESRKKLNEIAEENEHVKSAIKIILCEDDYGIRSTIKRLILKVSEDKKILVEIEEAINGLECLYKLYKDYINGIKYDSLLIDENMPFMKGSTCISLIRSMQADKYLNNIKIISISSFDDQDVMKFIKSQGCDEFMPKPHSKETISRFLESLVA